MSNTSKLFKKRFGGRRARKPGRGESKGHAVRALSEPDPLVTIRARKISELKVSISHY